MKTGASVFLTGEPGSGKTHTVNRYVKYLRGFDVSPAITASTGIAATHIGGTTIHSWSGIGIRRELSAGQLKKFFTHRAHLKKRIRETDVLIIDEISMLDGKTLALVDLVCKKAKNNSSPFGGMQVILVGDFFQLPPVSRNGEDAAFAFQSETWAGLDPRVLYLTEQHRQDDPDFLSVLQAIRSSSFEAAHYSHLKSRHISRETIPAGITKLYCHNANVDAVNAQELAKLAGEESLFEMTSSGQESYMDKLKKSCMSPEVLTLKTGALVMFTKNDTGAGYVNGTLGRIVGFDEEDMFPLVKTVSGKTIKAEPHDWSIEENDLVLATVTQVPLRLAWAITIHKSQGMSLDAAIMDLSRVFEFGQGYVALSRTRSLEGLHLLGMNHRATLVHPDVADADEVFRRRSDESEQFLARLPAGELLKQRENFIRSAGGKQPAAAESATKSARK